PLQASGGEMFSPSALYRCGMASPSSNAGDVTEMAAGTKAMTLSLRFMCFQCAIFAARPPCGGSTARHAPTGDVPHKTQYRNETFPLSIAAPALLQAGFRRLPITQKGGTATPAETLRHGGQIDTQADKPIAHGHIQRLLITTRVIPGLDLQIAPHRLAPTEQIGRAHV